MTTHAVGTQTLVKARLEGIVFDWIFLGACVWLVVGGYFDSWAHFNIPRLETFFTIWHAALYSGLLAVLLVLVGTVLINRFRGSGWHEAIPVGYDLSLVGVIGFVLAGIGDMIWHSLFGIEKNIDAQFSPTHVAIMICFGLITIGPYRALALKARSQQRAALFPLVTTLFLAFFHLVVMPVHPYNFYYPTDTTAAQTTEQTLAVVGYLFYGGVLSVLTQYTIRQWRVPPGFFTVLYTVTALAVSIMRAHFAVIGMALVSGVITDVLSLWLQPTVSRPGAFRLFVFLAAAVYYLVYFLALQLLYGVVWTIHLSLGTIVTSALLSWLLSYLVIPAAGTDEVGDRMHSSARILNASRREPREQREGNA